MAQHIAGAKFVELPSNDHLPWATDADAILDEIEEFITGERHGPDPDRILATILFTDIVGSTDRAAELGDQRWRDLLESFYDVVARCCRAFAASGGHGGRRRARHLRRSGAGHTLRAQPRGVGRPAGLAGPNRLAYGRMRGHRRRRRRNRGAHCRSRCRAGAPGEVLVSHTVKDLVAGSRIGSNRAARTRSRAFPENGHCLQWFRSPRRKMRADEVISAAAFPAVAPVSRPSP